jgi:hypothetical protein
MCICEHIYMLENSSYVVIFLYVLPHFDFTLSQRINLALHMHHVEAMTDEQVTHLFQMPKHEIVGIIENFQL